MIEESYELSPMQEAMVAQTYGAPTSGASVEQILGVLHEDLEPGAFRCAWERVVARHTALRTAFRWEGLESPRQDVHRQVDLPFEEQDLRGLTDADARAAVAAYLSADRRRGFDLGRPPLSRVALFRVGPRDYRCVWTFHHAIADGGSLAVVLREVFAHYQAARLGRDLTLPPATPYRRYVEWLRAADLGAAELFWRGALVGAEGPTPLAVARRAREDVGRPDTGRRVREHRLTAPLTAALVSLAAGSEVGFSTVVLGAWALLLARYAGEPAVLLGVTVAGRDWARDLGDSLVGMFINTLPLRVRVARGMHIGSWLRDLRHDQLAARPHAHAPLAKIREWSGLPPVGPLFDSIVAFDEVDLTTRLRRSGQEWEGREFELVEDTGFPLTLNAYGGRELVLRLAYDGRFDDETIERALGHLGSLLTGMAEHPQGRLADLPLLPAAERRTLLVDWNPRADLEISSECVHKAIEAQAARTPQAVALVCEDRALTYAELDRRANRLAVRLQGLGVGPDVLVGVLMERSAELVVGLLGVLKAGGAYVPLDPGYPVERLRLMIHDAGLGALVTQRALRERVPDWSGPVLCVDGEAEGVAESQGALEKPSAAVTADHLAYVIYTSGSTGVPKGVMVRHREVTGFFAAMDREIGRDPGVWLALTSPSFDISVLELFWTLGRGFKVVLHRSEAVSASAVSAPPSRSRPVEFSLFYFGGRGDTEDADPYRLLVEGARFADRHGFAAVWTPERHFHDFGGLYPNPAVTGAAVAAVTERVGIRAGSVVLPLQDPLRVAEEWSVVDNLSRGRVAVSFAAGWHPDDFVLAPDHYETRRDVLLREIETVRRLWRGESVGRTNGAGQPVTVRVFPKPVQAELPVWLTVGSGEETWRLAGELGVHVLTHLLDQNLDALAGKIAVYRRAWRERGHQGSDGWVTLMLHTYVGADAEQVRATVRNPLRRYIESSSALVHRAAGPGAATSAPAVPLGPLDRYMEQDGLIGTPERCAAIVDRLAVIGVDEVACLVDFGIDTEVVLEGLERLRGVRDAHLARVRAAAPRRTVGSEIKMHGVSHLQCTPSSLEMLSHDEDSWRALGALDVLLVGGEALPPALATRARRAVGGRVYNMYGPTETTVWSTCHLVRGDEDPVPIGRPLANTAIYLLDPHGEPVPIGVIGEVVIGGTGVARGYLGRPELTAERFVPSPFGTDQRLYRTGDLARYRPSGDIEFVGRADNQVKIRGHRVELGEIETLLGQHAGVREAIVVVAQESGTDGRSLIGYVVTEKSEAPTPSELRRFLAGRLPDHMLPAELVLLGTLPRTANGKVDRRALSLRPRPGPPSEESWIAPRTPLEERVAQIWREVLGRPRVGAEDNFLELGGNSLSAVRVFFEIKRTLGVEVSLASLMRTPSVAAMAAEVEEALLARADASTLERVVAEVEATTGDE